jgi:hypothetical protein
MGVTRSVSRELTGFTCFFRHMSRRNRAPCGARGSKLVWTKCSLVTYCRAPPWARGSKPESADYGEVRALVLPDLSRSELCPPIGDLHRSTAAAREAPCVARDHDGRRPSASLHDCGSLGTETHHVLRGADAGRVPTDPGGLLRGQSGLAYHRPEDADHVAGIQSARGLAARQHSAQQAAALDAGGVDPCAQVPHGVWRDRGNRSLAFLVGLLAADRHRAEAIGLNRQILAQ